MAEEKIVTLNFRKLSKPVRRTKRKSVTVNYLRSFLEKKSDKVKIDRKLSEKIWSISSRKTIGKIRIKLRKLDDGTIIAETVS